jgi:hypothetical protein
MQVHAAVGPSLRLDLERRCIQTAVWLMIMPMICMEMPCLCCRSLRSTGRGVRPAQLKSIFERPPTAAAAGEENQDPQAAGTLSDAACCESQGAGLTGEDVGLGAEHAPARQIVSSGMIWQVIHEASRDGCIMIAF